MDKEAKEMEQCTFQPVLRSRQKQADQFGEITQSQNTYSLEGEEVGRNGGNLGTDQDSNSFFNNKQQSFNHQE